MLEVEGGEQRAGCCDIRAGKLAVAEFVADIGEEPPGAEAPAAPPPLEETIVDCVRTFAGLRTGAQLIDLLHGEEKGHNQFRDSDFHGLLDSYSREEFWAALDRLIDAGDVTVSAIERLHA